MRVVSVAFTFYVRDGRVRRACEALAARGDQVTVIPLAEAGRPDREEIAGVEVWRVPVSRRSLTTHQTRARYLQEYAAFGAAVARALAALQRQGPVDLVHVNNMPDALVFAALGAMRRRVPVLLDVHDLMPDLFVNKFGGDGGGLLARALVAQVRASAALADGVLTVHDEAADLLAAYGVPRERIHVVLNAADDAVFTWRGFKAPGDDFVVAYHGSVSRRHGLDLALEALARVRDRLPPGTRLKILGEGDAVDEVAALRTRLGLEDLVELTPHFVPVEEIPAFLADVDLALAPYRQDPATELMLPCKLFDLGSVGIPVVLSRLACVSRYFDEGAVTYVPAGDVGALGEALVALANDPARRRRQVGALHARTDALSWPVQRAAYLDLVDDLVARGGRGPARAVAAAGAEGIRGLLRRPVTAATTLGAPGPTAAR